MSPHPVVRRRQPNERLDDAGRWLRKDSFDETLITWTNTASTLRTGAYTNIGSAHDVGRTQRRRQ